MGSCNDKLRTARINVKRGTEEQRRNALEDLREICSEYMGAPCAQRAQKLLKKYDSSSSKEDTKPSSLDELEESWASLQGLRDGRFRKYFQEIQEHDLERSMKETVVRSLRNWLEEESTELRRKRRLDDAKRAAEILQEIESVETYAIELIDEIEGVHEAVFEIYFGDRQKKVKSALEQWAVQDARRYFKEIMEQGPVPDSMQESVHALRSEIEEIDKVRRSVESRLNEMAEARIQSWGDAEYVHSTIQFFDGLDTSIPDSEEQNLKRVIDEKLECLNEFILQKAEDTDSLEEISEFWQSYRRRGLLAAEHVEEDAIAAKSRDAVEAIVHRRIKQAETPAEVEDLKTELNRHCTSPPVLRELVSSVDTLKSEVQTIEQEWQAMRDGRQFSVPEGSVPIPPPFKDNKDEYEQYLSKVNFPFRNKKGSVPEDTLRRAIDVAESILDEIEDHDEALALKQDAENRLLHQNLDASLANWRLANFQKYAAREQAPERYRRLLENHFDTLQEMARLQAEDEFTGWEEAVQWSERWKVDCQTVREGFFIPDALDGAINDETKRREVQWERVLAQLREQNATTAEELTTLHQRIEDLLDVFELASEQKLLEREILRRRMRTALEEESIDEAQNFAEQLEERFSGPPQELAVRLDVEQARRDSESAKALAELLDEKWHRVRTAYGEDALTLLVDTLAQNWEASNYDVIYNDLKPLLRRPQEEEMPSELVRWDTWLDLERHLLEDVSWPHLKRLEEYAQAPPSDRIRDRQLKRLLQQWRNTNNWRALSWMFRAFPVDRSDLFPSGEDPVERLRERSREETASIRDDLVDQIRAAGSGLGECKKRLNEELGHWRDLQDFYEGSTFDPPQPPDELEEVKKLLRATTDVQQKFESLQNDLVYEWQSDLKRKSLTNKWKSFENARFKIVDSITEPEVGEKFLGRHDELWSLAEDIRHYKEDGGDLEQKVKEVAEFCGRTDERAVRQKHRPPGDGDRPFRLLASHLKDVQQRLDDVSSEWSEILTLPDGKSVPEEMAQQFQERIWDWAEIRSWPPLAQEQEDGGWEYLIARVQELNEQEEQFRNQIEKMRQHPAFEKTPQGGTFEPHEYSEHQEFLKLLPDEVPRSERVFRYFELFATSQPMPTILGECPVEEVPDWMDESGLTNNQRR